MPHFMMLFDDDKDFDVSEPLRAEHHAYLLGLGEKVVLGASLSDGGPTPSGRLVVADFRDLRAAEDFAAHEPLVLAGRVKHWKVAAAAIAQKDGVYIPVH